MEEVKDHQVNEEEARDIAKGCVAIEKEDREVREADEKPELSAGEFFAACEWLGKNIPDEAFENEDLDAALDQAWSSVETLPEAAGWTKEAAGEVLFHCLKAAEDFEKVEGTRPKKPQSMGGDGDGKRGGDDESDRPEKPEGEDKPDMPEGEDRPEDEGLAQKGGRKSRSIMAQNNAIGADRTMTLLLEYYDAEELADFRDAGIEPEDLLEDC